MKNSYHSHHILIFSTAYFPLVGGAEIAFKEITDRIKNYQFDLITARFSKRNAKKEKIGNITVHRVGLGTKFDKYLLPILGLFKAKRLFKKNKHFLIWSISASQAGLAALFLKLKNPKIPFLLTIQEGSSEKRIFWRRFMVWPLFKMIFKKADYIQAISNFLANFAKKIGAQCPIEVVPNGVDVRKFQIPNSKFQIDKLKKELDIKENEKVIITVSRLVPKNAIGDLIESLRYLDLRINPAPFEDKRCRVKLLILGTGFEEKKLKNLAKKLNLEDKILFLGLIPPVEVPKYLAISDVFIRPSISEGLGNVFLEAMAARVPIIGTPVGGIPDFLENEKTGLFCQPRNPKSIAEAIKFILEDEELCSRLVENGKRLVEEKYSWGIIAEKMNNLFKKLFAPSEI